MTIPFYIAFLPLLLHVADTRNAGGVCFSFDGAHVESWASHAQLFDKYNIKATFFISRPHKLTELQIKLLHNLCEKGHKVGCHGYNHKSIKDYGYNDTLFYAQEVNPGYRTLLSYGFAPVAFAYPFGLGSKTLDSLILQIYSAARWSTWNQTHARLDYIDEVYATPNNCHSVNSMGIDCNYYNSQKMVTAGMSRARRRNQVLMLYATKIDESGTEYTVSAAYLETLFAAAQRLNLRSITIDQVSKHFQSVEDCISKNNSTENQ